MTKDDAINILLDHLSVGLIRTLEDAIAKEEREECAKVALQGTDEPVQTDTLEIIKKERQRISAAIKARGQE